MNMQDMDVQDFVELNVKRQLYAQFRIKDPAPNMYYSVSYNDSLYLDLLQKVDADKWNEIGTREYWQFLHIGGEKPN